MTDAFAELLSQRVEFGYLVHALRFGRIDALGFTRIEDATQPIEFIYRPQLRFCPNLR